jgi:hypothetical protein
MPKHDTPNAKRLSVDVMFQRIEIKRSNGVELTARHHQRAQCGGLIT